MSNSFSKILITLRITIFIVLASLLQTFANDNYSQTTDCKITLAPEFLSDGQQQDSIFGKVTNNSGEPLPGVTVLYQMQVKMIDK